MLYQYINVITFRMQNIRAGMSVSSDVLRKGLVTRGTWKAPGHICMIRAVPMSSNVTTGDFPEGWRCLVFFFVTTLPLLAWFEVIISDFSLCLNLSYQS